MECTSGQKIHYLMVSCKLKDVKWQVSSRVQALSVVNLELELGGVYCMYTNVAFLKNQIAKSLFEAYPLELLVLENF